MKRRYNKFNPQKKIRILSESDSAWLKELFDTVGYDGNPQHKKNPGDFKLVPPRDPREGKSLCDEIEIFRRSEALRLLREGIRHGLISESGTEKFPQNIWSVIELPEGKSVPLEAQLGNSVLGLYHGYPLQKSDPMYDKILEQWSKSDVKF